MISALSVSGRMYVLTAIYFPSAVFAVRLILGIEISQIQYALITYLSRLDLINSVLCDGEGSGSGQADGTIHDEPPISTHSVPGPDDPVVLQAIRACLWGRLTLAERGLLWLFTASS